jgi:hypothetical protein
MNSELVCDQSGWRDSNPRPPAPKAGALTKLRYIPAPRGAAGRTVRGARRKCTGTGAASDTRFTAAAISASRLRPDGAVCRVALAEQAGTIAS